MGGDTLLALLARAALTAIPVITLVMRDLQIKASPLLAGQHSFHVPCYAETPTRPRLVALAPDIVSRTEYEGRNSSSSHGSERIRFSCIRLPADFLNAVAVLKLSGSVGGTIIVFPLGEV
jgi:hypothetical protein